MRQLILEQTLVTTRMDPVAAHLAHVRHLARSASLQQVLRDVHEYQRADAKRLAEQTAPFVEQGLRFHEVSLLSAPRVRPVVQYYAYMNLAVAVVLIYRPNGWQDYKQHGAEDNPRSLKRLTMSSPIVRMLGAIVD